MKRDEQVFDFIENTALDGFWVWDLEKTALGWINPTFANTLGYTSPTEYANLMQKCSYVFEDESILNTIPTTHFINDPFSLQISYRHKDGTTSLMNCSCVVFNDSEGKANRLLGTNKVAESKVKPHELSVLEAVGSGVKNSGAIYILKTDVLGNYIYSNDYFYEVFGFAPHEILGTNALDSIIPEDHAACRETVVKCFMYPKTPFKVVLSKRHKKGHIITNQWEFTGLPDADGKTFEILCIGYNVSEKVKTENDLSILVANMTDLLISVDYFGNISYASPNITALYYYDLEEIIGKAYLDFVHPDDIEIGINAVKQSLATKIPFKNVEVRLKRKDGTYVWTNTNSSINPLNNETILVINDISDKVESLNELKQTKELLEEVSEVSNVGGWEYFPSDKSFFWSGITRKIFGLNQDFVPNLNKILPFFKPESKAKFLSAIKKAVKTKNFAADLEMEIITAQQQELWLRVIIKNNSTDEVCHRIYGTFQDIDQLKKAELAREASSLMLKQIAKQVPGMLYQFQLFDDGRSFFPFVSRDIIKTADNSNSKNEEITKGLFKLIHPDDAPMVMQEIKKSFHSLTLTDIEFRIFTLSGKVRWLKAISTPERLKDSVIWHGYMSDITERKIVEQELRRTKNYLQETTQVARIGGWEIDLNTNTVYLSELTKEMHGIDKNEYMDGIDDGINFYKEGRSREMMREALEKLIKYETPFDLELQIITLQGKEMWIRAIGKADFSDPNRKRVYGTFQDIDQRKRAEIETEKANQLLKHLSKQVPGGLCQYQYYDDGHFDFPYMSEGFLNLFQIQKEEIIENPRIIYDRIHPDDLPLYHQSLIESYHNLTIWHSNFRIFLPSGEIRWIGNESSPERLENRVIWHGYFSDITDAKNAEVQLTRTRDLLEETNRVARVGGWSIDIPNNKVYWSKIVKEIIEVPNDFEPSLEFGLSLYKEGYSRYIVTEAVNKCVEDGTPFEVEVQVVSTETKEEIWVKVIGKAEYENGKVKRVYGIFQDINQSKIAEENKKNLQALEVLLVKERQLNLLKSRFISLASHEFRTPLASILGSTDLLELYAENIENTAIKNKMQEHLNHIISKVDRLTGMVSDILTLEKTAEGKTTLELKAVKIVAFLQKLAQEYDLHHRDKRKLVLILPAEEKEVLSDESLLLHILNNLISNAFKYSRGVENGPELQLEYFEKSFIISVKDYGMGIPAKDQKQLFETFYRASNVISTEGTGLGLSIAKEFTLKLGGEISFESAEGKGSIFRLELPYNN
ncbi:sensor histidine kinase [Arcicella rigui]|uniref:histidine kinase n=1 Tax=Arcicella rigui TaxID=797020 RepID=A0ABU5Q685_9BACT|nr:PAS domain-containing protein [Arcicella rigui]MEA5138365.1 PAS domain-containing protein [Arcicella rigui]